MPRLPDKGYGWIYNFLSSKELTIILITGLCPVLIVTTFFEAAAPFVWHIIRTLLAMIVVNLFLCTLQRIKTLSKPVLILHVGIIVTFMGGGISSFGYIATVNIYEGSTVDRVYRWDVKKDVSLGMDITVKKLHEEYYPAPLKVGVLRGGEKLGLFTLKTGESFNLENNRIQADSLDIKSQSLRLSIFNGDKYIGYADTSGVMELPADFPFEFKLVAYKNPAIKRTWLDLVLSKNGEVVAEGRTEVNSPLEWRGLKYFHTATNRDPYRNPFVGIQITRDPGTPVVYAGFCIVGIGGTIYLFRKIRA
ncbi:MAG: ResB-like family cytochrome C biogenesis protein [Nitrospirae bacterium]|nr:ResB-like family cytochrome C biogenesis protein [Nitrospirota bacterium]